MTQSETLFNQSKDILVGGVNSPVRSFGSMQSTPIFIKKGQGARITSEDKNTFVDYVLGWGPMLLGHSDPDITESICKAATQGTTFGAATKIEYEYAKELQKRYPSLEKLRVVNSGTEATMSALRLARGYTGKRKIIKFNGCYHGHSDYLLVKSGSGALTGGIPDSKGVLKEFTEHTLTCEFNDQETVKKLFQNYGGDIAAIILEPIAGNMGLILPEENFLKTLRSLCTQNNTLLVFDEVMCGIRCHKDGAQALYNITPDLTCLGKVIGGGLPCGVYGGKKEIMDHLAPLGGVYQAGTFSGNHITMAAGLSTLQKINQHPIFEKAEQSTSELVTAVQEFVTQYKLPIQVTSIGTMFHFYFCQSPVKNLQNGMTADTETFKKFFHLLLNEGIYFPPSQFESCFMSSQHDEKIIKKTIQAIQKALKEIYNLK